MIARDMDRGVYVDQFGYHSAAVEGEGKRLPRTFERPKQELYLLIPCSHASTDIPVQGLGDQQHLSYCRIGP